MKILVIQGHPDPAGGHFGHALADAYAQGAKDGGHEVRRIDIARAGVDFINNQSEFASGPLPDYARAAQADITWAEHLVLIFPLWHGGMPARLKAWIEQVFRYGFAMEVHSKGFKRLLKHKTARVVVTMGTPAFFYRLYFGAHGTKLLRRSILGFSGIGPIDQTLIGRVEDIGAKGRARWLERLKQLGREAK